ncbi:MAG: hypothetical protein LJE83_04250 [Gammaproteobacteria bacterium]|nr:hypothetical protein [Gammaproteobacteria bacterium]
MASAILTEFTKSTKPRILVSILLVSISLFSIFQVFDAYGEKHTMAGFNRSLASFAIAKGLNSAISIVQETEVALEPGGIGIILSPGQILDPANDLVERFSNVMLICTTSFGIQAILLKIFSSYTFSAIVSLSLLGTLILIWNNDKYPDYVKNFLYRLVVFLVILRFCIPAMTIINNSLYTGFLETKYIESTQQLQDSDKAIADITSKSSDEEQDTVELSWYEMIGGKINKAMDSLDIKKQIETQVDKLKAEVERITNNIIDLIIVFIIQTILFPLLFLWLILKMLKINYSFKYV